MVHSYFAYGSNLCVKQMARRCPDAADPRPATLADHDWLINERGVATVEPFDGSQVHGVVWQLDDHDLATLDSAEGVPVRYRRDRLTVHTDDGPAEAWVYIDHRVDPGPPRPGYLERIIDGAHHHGLPHRWIEFLRRWDPSHWPVPNGQLRIRLRHNRFRSCSPIPASLEESTLRSRFGFMAIHGGGLEQMTDVIAERAAEAAGASVYVLRHPENYPHHLPSARYLAQESERLAEFLDHVDVAVSLHGYGRIGSQHPAARRRAQPRPRRTPGPARLGARLPRRHRPRRDPPRTARHASRQPGQPRPRRRRPARTHAAGARHQPTQRARRRRRTVPGDIRPDPGSGGGSSQLEISFDIAPSGSRVAPNTQMWNEMSQAGAPSPSSVAASQG